MSCWASEPEKDISLIDSKRAIARFADWAFEGASENASKIDY